MKNVHITRFSERFSLLHDAVLDLVAVINRPQRDEFMLKAAGLSLERALFPLLVTVGRRGPIGIVEIADRMGRDHTTVSRQIARLEELGLVERQVNAKDRRIREAVITAKGRAVTDRIDATRDRIAGQIFADWDEADFDRFATLMRRYADAMMETPDIEEADVTTPGKP